MPRYVALLRAINVGGHTVRMSDLRDHFEAMAFTGVSTFIASGNVVFDSPGTSTRKLEATIERGLKASLGYEVGTFIRTLPELEAVAAYRPFPAAMLTAAGSSLYVMFLAEPVPGSTRRRLQALRTDLDDFHARGREVYWYCRGKLTDSLVNSTALSKAIGAPTTMRNVTSLRKLVAKYRDA